MREIIVNLKETILTYAAAKNHTHEGYIGNDQLTALSNELEEHKTKDAKNEFGHTQLANNIASDVNNPVAGKTIVSYVTGLLNNYYTKDQANSTFYNKSTIDTKINDLLGRIRNLSSSISNPQETTKKINQLVAPGYYIYTGANATFTCDPDIISYKNALIKVEKQSNHYIQHVYATSYSTSSQKYKIDGRIFVRHGYTTTDTNGDTNYHWEKWYVSHLPWRERPDLLKTKGDNVDTGSFKIYECTPGYVFKWKQTHANNAYTLPASKYNYANVYTFKTLPIVSGYTVGNLIGHMDIRIMNDSFKARSTNGKGEVITGVDVSYFVPRTN